LPGKAEVKRWSGRLQTRGHSGGMKTEEKGQVRSTQKYWGGGGQKGRSPLAQKKGKGWEGWSRFKKHLKGEEG